MSTPMPIGTNADKALKAATKPIDYSAIDNIADQIGQPGALDGIKGQIGGVQDQLQQVNKAKSTFDYIQNDSASAEDKAKFSGTGILKKFTFLCVKGLQAYIVLSINYNFGNIFTYGVTGTFQPWITALVFASFLAQLFDLILLVAPELGAKLLHDLHADFLIKSMGTVGVFCSTTLIFYLTVPDWGADGYPVDFLRDIIQYQVMLGNLDSGLFHVLSPPPKWLTALIEFIESLPAIIYNKIKRFFTYLFDAIRGHITWVEFGKDLLGIVTEPLLPPVSKKPVEKKNTTSVSPQGGPVRAGCSCIIS
jgi:hypothetical protein